MRWGLALALLIASASDALAQPAPVPPQPYPPYPYPYPYAPPPPPTLAPPAAPEKPKVPPMAVLFHGLCPENYQPMCSVGLWMGVRGTMLVGSRDASFGLALDIKAGFSFGGGLEMGDQMPEDRDGMGHATAIAEAAIGPGVRAGMIEILPAIGFGGEAVAWGSAKVDDDPYSEAYWYAILAGHVRLDGYTLLASATRKFENRGLTNVYENRVEAGVAFAAPKGESLSISIWYSQYEHHLVAGLALGIGSRDLVDQRAPTTLAAP